MNRFEQGVVVTLVLAILSGVYFVGELNGRLKAIENDKDYISFKAEKNKALSELDMKTGEAISRIQQEGQKFIGSLGNQDQRIAALENRVTLTEGATRFAFTENEHKCPNGWDYFMKSVTAADPGNVNKAIVSGMARALFDFGGYPSVHSVYCIRK